MELKPRSTGPVPAAIAHNGGKGLGILQPLRIQTDWSPSSQFVDSSPQCVWLPENTFLVMLAHGE